MQHVSMRSGFRRQSLTILPFSDSLVLGFEWPLATLVGSLLTGTVLRARWDSFPVCLLTLARRACDVSLAQVWR